MNWSIWEPKTDFERRLTEHLRGTAALGRSPQALEDKEKTMASSNSPKKGFLSGYKTYIVSALTVVSAAAAYLVGEPVPGSEGVLTLPALAQLVVTAILAATIRSGVKNDSQK